MNPTTDIKEAAKSAFKIRYIFAVLFALFIINLVLEMTGVGKWFWTPIASFNAWNAQRKAKAAAGK